MKKYNSRLKKKIAKQVLLLTVPLLFIIAAYAVCIYALDIGGKIDRLENEIYSEIYHTEADGI